MKQEYLTYDATELAQDTDFIRWVRQPDDAPSERWVNWLTEHPDQQEKVTTARTLVEAVQWPLPSLSPQEKAGMWAVIDAATPTEARRVQLRTRTWMWTAAAAVLLLLAAGWWWIQTPEPTALYAARTEKGYFDLPDGSSVSLNAVTEVQYETSNWKQERRINLDGEAFFEVEKGVPFIVETPYGTVEVLGTSFNVEARPGIFRVNCYTGKVKVSLPNGDSKIITPQQGVEVVDGQLEERTVNNELDIAWQAQIHHFKEQPLDEVFAELERQYPVNIQYPASIAKALYTGSFKNNELEQALQSICWPLNLKFTIAQDQVLIQEDK